MEINSTKTQWKQFRYFLNDDTITQKLEEFCRLFCKFQVADIVTDYLLNIFIHNPEHKSEATFLLNSIFSGK